MDKKSLRAQVEAKIDAALADFTKDLSDKKYKKHIKKAAKILSDGLAIASPKKAATTNTAAAPVAKKAKNVPKKTTKTAKAAKVAKKAPAKSAGA